MQIVDRKLYLNKEKMQQAGQTETKLKKKLKTRSSRGATVRI